MKKKKLLMTAIAIFGLATITMAQTIPSYVPTVGLVGWWPFNGNAYDESSNTNDGTVNGATLTIDRNGIVNSAFDFNGSNSTINCSNPSIPQNGSFSISFWINPSSVSGVQEFFHQNVWPGAFYVGINGGNMRCGDYWQNTGVSINSMQWQHFIIVRNYMTNVEIYLNGTLQASLGTDISLGGNITDPLVFGKQYGGNAEYYNGILDDVGIWNRPISECEIQDLYHAQLGSQAISAGLDQSICAGDNVTLNGSGGSNYQWDNNVVDGQAFAPGQSDSYVVNGTDTIGCQGSDTVVITVLENATSSLTQTALDSYTLNGQTYTESGTYTQTIPSVNGCDSVITLNLTLNFTGLSQEESTLFVLYPNPASEQITIKTDAGMIGKEYALYNQVGKLITKGKLTGENTSLSLQGLARGLYSIAIQGQEKKSFTISKE